MRRVVLVALVACAESNVVVCGDGRVCPADYACDEVHSLCVLPAQLMGCPADDNTVACTLPGDRAGQCNQGVCLEVVCGDGIVAGLEDCEPGDGATYECADHDYYDAKTLICSDACVFPETQCTGTCGDGLINGPSGQETCEVGVPPATSCLDFGYETGRISCNTSACGPNLVACRDIGFVPMLASVGQSHNTVLVAAPGHVFLSETPSNMIEIVNGQVTRTDVGDTVFALWGTSPTNLYAGSPGKVLHYDGAAWSAAYTGSEFIYGLWGTGGDVYAVGADGTLLKSTGSGAFLPIDQPWTANTWFGVWGPSATEVFVVGNQGAVRKLNASGVGTQLNASACWNGDPTIPNFRAVWGTSASNVFVVGNENRICHYNGSTWTRMSTSAVTTPTDYLAVWGRGPNDIFVTGTNGVIVRFDGVRWRQVVSDIDSAIYSVHGNGSELAIAGDRVASRYAGALYANELIGNVMGEVDAPSAQHEYVINTSSLYERGTAMWNEVEGPYNQLLGLWVDPSGTAFIAANGVLGRRVGTVQTDYAIALEATAITGRSASDVFAVGLEGKVAHFDGGNWTTTLVPGANADTDLHAVACGPTVAYAVGRETVDTFYGIAYKHTTAGWAAMTLPADTPPLEAVHALSDTHAIAVGDGGVILETTDGATWTRQDSGTTIQLLDVDSTGPNDIFVTGRGTMLRYDGAGWLPIKIPLSATGKISVRADAIHITTSSGVTILQRDASW